MAGIGDPSSRPYEPRVSAPLASYRRPAFELKKGAHIMLQNRPCKVVQILYSKDEAGQSHKRFIGLDFFTNQRYEHSTASVAMMTVPYIYRKEYQLIDILENGCASLIIDGCGEKREDLRIPEWELGAKIRAEFADKTKNVFCTVSTIVGEDGITDTRSADKFAESEPEAAAVK